MNKIKVAIAMATYNGELFIEQQLQSLLNQTYRDFVCYIHDDGSKDNTVRIIKQYTTNYPDRFIELNFPVCGSAKTNFWELMLRINTDVLFFCDQDDIWMQDKIEKLVSKIVEIDKNVPGLVFCDMKVVDSDLSEIDASFIHFSGYDTSRTRLCQLIPQNIAAGCCMAINRALKEEALRCPNVDSIRMHDWWLMLVASCVGKIVFVNESLQLYRQHIGNSLGAIKDKGFTASMSRVKRLLLGKQIRQTKKRIKEHQIQASLLYVYKGKTVEIDEIIDFFAKIEEKNKIQRILGYCTYKIFRNNKRNWWTLLWV